MEQISPIIPERKHKITKCIYMSPHNFQWKIEVSLKGILIYQEVAISNWILYPLNEYAFPN